MTQKTAFILASVITSFLLVVAGGVAARAALPAAAPTTSVIETVATPADLQQREAEYQALIQQANAQLQEAYAQQQALQAQLNQSANLDQASSPTLTPEAAVRIALNAAPGATLLSQPELGNLQGVPVYAVTLSRGVVYVDSTSGQVLYNSTVAAAPAAGGEYGESHEHEHEGGGHD